MRLSFTLLTLLPALYILSACQSETEDNSDKQTKELTYTMVNIDTEYVNLDGFYIYLHDSKSGEVIAQAQPDESKQVHFEVPIEQEKATVTVASLKPYKYHDGVAVYTYVDLPVDYSFLYFGGSPQKMQYQETECEWKTINHEFKHLPKNTRSLIVNGDLESVLDVAEFDLQLGTAQSENTFCDQGDGYDAVFEAIDEEGNKLSYGFMRLDEIEDGATYNIDMSLLHQEVAIGFATNDLPKTLRLSATDIYYSTEIKMGTFNESTILVPIGITDNIWELILTARGSESGRLEYLSSYPINDLNYLANIDWQQYDVSDIAYSSERRTVTWNSRFIDSDLTSLSLSEGNVRWDIVTPENTTALVLPQLPSGFQVVNDALIHADFEVGQSWVQTSQKREQNGYARADEIPNDWLGRFSARDRYLAATEQLSGIWQSEGEYYLQLKDDKLVTYDYLPEHTSGACYQIREHQTFFSGFSISVLMDDLNNTFSAELEQVNTEQLTMTVQVAANLANHYKKPFEQLIVLPFAKSAKQAEELSPLCKIENLAFDIEQPSLGHFIISKQGDPLVSPFSPFFREMPKQMREIEVGDIKPHPELKIIKAYTIDEGLFNRGSFLEIENTSTMNYYCGLEAMELRLVDTQQKVIDSDYGNHAFVPFLSDSYWQCLAPQSTAYLYNYWEPEGAAIKVQDYNFFPEQPELPKLKMQDFSIDINQDDDGYQGDTELHIGKVIGGQLLDQAAPALMFDAHGLPFNQDKFYINRAGSDVVFSGRIDWGLVSRIEVFVPYSE